jgi:asparagine N-glycosylation enzyme membrane subunit Stt3
VKRTRAIGAIALVALLGTLARVSNFAQIFRDGFVELLPSDSHYYVRFALLQRHAFPHFVTFDPFVNFPRGAEIYWPPLHTAFVAIGTYFGRGPEAGAAWVGPVLSLIWLVALTAFASRRLGLARAFIFGALLALIPSVIGSGNLGNADHHVHEPFLAACIALAFTGALESDRRGSGAWTGGLLALGKLLTPTSVIFIPLVALSGAVAALAAPARRLMIARRCIEAGLTAAGFLLVVTLAWGQLFSLEYEALSGFHVLFSLAALLGAGAFAYALARARMAWLAGAVALLAALALAPELARAAAHFGRVAPELTFIDESQPLWRHLAWAKQLLGIAALLLPCALVAGAIALVRRRAGSLGLLAPVVFTLALGLAAAEQARFAAALCGAGALLVPFALADPFALARARQPIAAWAVIAILALPLLASLAPPDPPDRRDVDRIRPLMTWMREHTPSPGPAFDTTAHPAYGVAAHFVLGHFLTLWAERPAIATPFALTPWHTEANERVAQLLSTEDDERAYKLARQTGARYVIAIPLLRQPGHDTAHPERTLAGRLFDDAGMDSAHFRLVHETTEPRLDGTGSFARLFDVVPGAQLTGHARPGAQVRASLELVSNTGERLLYLRQAAADASGNFALTLAHATTRTGEVHALGPLQLEVDGVKTTLELASSAVERGETIALPLLEPEPAQHHLPDRGNAHPVEKRVGAVVGQHH